MNRRPPFLNAQQRMPLPPSSMRRDIASAYLAVAARVGGMLVVSAVVYRQLGFEAFAVFNLVRATVGLLNYTALGLAPAMVRMLAEAGAPRPVLPVAEAEPSSLAATDRPTLAYASPLGQDATANPVVHVYAAGEIIAVTLTILGLLLAALHATLTAELYGLTSRVLVAPRAEAFALSMGMAVVVRLLSEPPSSLLLVCGRQSLDNALLATAEVLGASLGVFALARLGADAASVGWAYVVANLVLLVMRVVAAAGTAPGMVGKGLLGSPPQTVLAPIQNSLLLFGALVTLGQLADFLYAPLDYVLITRLLRVEHVGIYAPAVQIDAGLLTLVAGLSAVLLPKTAVAHAGGDTGTVRDYYVRGTLASAALLVVASLLVWVLSPWILRLWLGNDMPETRAILPMVFVHTVVGGSSSVGRAVLLGMGKVKPFTASVLIAGVGNVVLSYVFVRYFGLGLKGIVLGTIVVVVARAGVWMPWYVLRVLRRGAVPPDSGISPVRA